MICWGSAAVLSGIAVIYLAHRAPSLGGTEIRQNAGISLAVAPYYTLKAVVQCVAANLVAKVA
jgi:hypothetical protein